MFLTDPFVVIALVVLSAGVLIVLGSFIGAWRTLLLIALLSSILRSSMFASAALSTALFVVHFGGVAGATILGMTRPRGGRASVASRWLVGFAVFAVLSTLWSVAPDKSILQGASLLLIASLLVVSGARRWQDSTVLRGDLLVVYVTIASVSLFGLFLWLTNRSLVIGSVGRYQGILVNPNYAGMISAVGMAILPWLYRPSGGRVRFFLLAGFLANAATLVLCGSRGALLAVVLGFLSLLLVSASARLVWIIGLPLLLGLAIVIGPQIAALDSIDRTVQNGDFFSGRLDIWSSAIQVWLANPWIGTGFATSQYAVELHGFTAHNLFLGTLVELGVLGFIALAGVVVITFRIAKPTLGADRSLISVVVVFTISQQFEAAAFGFGGPVAFLLWLGLGVAMARSSVGDSRGKSESVNIRKVGNFA